jgi:RNA polymerase sigma-70 factor (ECF subfamily)
VAAALLVSEATMAKRLVRAKRKIAVAGIPFRTPAPAELPERLTGVATTVYLLFNEGYHASSGDSPLRRQLVDEALRLAVLLRQLLPDQISLVGLEALIRLQDARSPARLGPDGRPVRLADQDRARWNRDQIRAGMVLLGIALRVPTDRPDPFVVQAAIAACHDLAPTWEATPWEAIVSWYDVLLTVIDTPVVRVNRAVAVAEFRGADAGLAALEAADPPGASLPLVAARGELLARAGRTEEARAVLADALALPGNEGSRRELRRRLAELA